MASIAKWYSKTEYYDEEGIQISKKQAEKHYIIKNRIKRIKIEGATGYITYWYICEKDKQLKLWQTEQQKG